MCKFVWLAGLLDQETWAAADVPRSIQSIVDGFEGSAAEALISSGVYMNLLFADANVKHSLERIHLQWLKCQHLQEAVSFKG